MTQKPADVRPDDPVGGALWDAKHETNQTEAVKAETRQLLIQAIRDEQTDRIEQLVKACLECNACTPDDILQIRRDVEFCRELRTAADDLEAAQAAYREAAEHRNQLRAEHLAAMRAAETAVLKADARRSTANDAKHELTRLRLRMPSLFE